MAATRYFQVGGLNPDVEVIGENKYKTDKHAQILYSLLQQQQNRDDGLVEMILAMTLKGASYLLLTDAEMRTFCHGGSSLQLRRDRRGCYAHDFESLSPIYFTVETLQRKLADLRPKQGSREDTSKANNGYIGPSSQLENDHPHRGAFEHSRLLYRILDHSIEPGKYGATNISWNDDLHIRAFSINVDSLDSRPGDRRKADPRVLDVGVCDAKTSMAPIPDYSTGRHIRHPQNKFLMARSVKKDYIRENKNATEEPVDIGETVRNIFADYQEKTDSPLVLLVHDEERTCNFLKNMQVNTSNWRSGLKDLVNPGDTNRGHRTNDYEQRSYTNRDNGRAASPRRNYGQNHYRQETERRWSGSNQRERGTGRDWPQGAPQKQPQRPYAPVYIVDVLRMYKTFMQTGATTDPINDNVVLLAKLLDIGGVDETNWWCAGEEAGLLIEMWCAMASGADLDGERKLYTTRGQNDDDDEEEEEEEEEAAGPSGMSVQGSSSRPAHDDDDDPNTAPQPAAVQTKHSDWFSEDDSGDSDSD